MAADNSTAERSVPQEPIPVPTMAEVASVPMLSQDGLSFVILKSAADLENLSDDSDLGDFSLVQESKQLIAEELAKLDSQTSTTPNQTLVADTGDPLQSNGSSSHVTLTEPAAKPKSDSNSFNESVQNALPELPASMVSVNQPEEESGAISIFSVNTSDFDSGSIYNKITQLIEENTALKAFIEENNKLIKKRNEQIQLWQKETNEVHEMHKQKHCEAKKCILALQQENARLKQENDDALSSLRNQQTEHDKTKLLLADSTQNNMQEFQLDIAMKKVTELEDAFEQSKVEKEQTGAELQKLKVQNDELVAAQMALRAELDMTKSNATNAQDRLQEKLSRYERELEACYKKMLVKNDAAQVEVNKLEEELRATQVANDRLRAEVDALGKRLAKDLQVIEETAKLTNALEQVKTLQDEIDSRNATITATNMRCTELETRLKSAEELIETLESTVKMSKETLEQTNIELWQCRQELSESNNACQDLRQQMMVRTGPAPCKHEEWVEVRQQLMESQKNLVESQQNRAVATAQLTVLQNENQALKRRLEARQGDEDGAFALRTQLDLYKNDFEAERQAKEDVKREKDKAVVDLQHLNRRNQQLQEEIEYLREQLQRNGIPMTRFGASRPNRSAQNNSQDVIRCPKCSFGFNTLEEAQYHVNSCIELDESLP